MDRDERKDFLLEIGCEELPPGFIPEALQQLQRGIAALLGEQRLAFESSKAYATPRRLTLLVKGLAALQLHVQQ